MTAVAAPLVAPPLVAMRRIAVAPRGRRFQPGRLLRAPVVALRGGPEGIAAAFDWDGEALGITILGLGALQTDEVDAALATARGMSGVDDDTTPFFEQAREHPVLGPLAKDARFDGRLRRTRTVFEAFAEAVIAQLVTSVEAQQATRRLFAHAGALIPGTDLRAAPTPAAVRDTPAWQMHAMGIGSRRAQTLREGARRGATLERIGGDEPELFMQKLRSMPGVGPWTANRVARNALAYADAVPVGDLHAPRIVTAALQGRAAFGPDADEAMLAALEPFRPHRGRVVMLLDYAHFVRDAVPNLSPRERTRVDAHRRAPWRY